MAEERNCGTCKYLDEKTLEYIHQRCVRSEGVCMNHGKWQPIQKAPSFQMTEEEANIFYTDNLDIINVSRNEFISCLKNGNYIRKSKLVELVEEAEKMYCDYRNIAADIFKKKYDGSSVVAVLSRYHDALQALKKDHPEFGGKK